MPVVKCKRIFREAPFQYCTKCVSIANGTNELAIHEHHFVDLEEQAIRSPIPVLFN